MLEGVGADLHVVEMRLMLMRKRLRVWRGRLCVRVFASLARQDDRAELELDSLSRELPVCLLKLEIVQTFSSAGCSEVVFVGDGCWWWR